jgi:predicted porin
MKKTLIALAVLAASGASFAQVTMSGNVGFGFDKSASQTASNGNNGSGMTTTDGTINFTAKEDLGGGMSVIASTEFQLRGRTDAAAGATPNSNSFRPRNATLAMITPVGVFSAGSIESPSGFFRTTSYTDSWNTGFDNANGPWDGKANIDFVRYLVPISAVKGLQLSAWYTEVGAGVANGVTIGSATKITAPVLMANFSAGPITAYADYTNFTAQKAAGVPAAITAVLSDLTRYRIGADYNFGMAKVSVGYQTRDHDLPDQYAFGLTVPLGATTLNLTYGARDSQKAAPKYGLAADVERTATGLQVRYNFSKTTFAEVAYATYTGGGKIANGERDLSDEYRIRMNKSF